MRNPDWRELRERWFFPCTLWVLLYLLYSLVVCIFFQDSVRATSMRSLVALQADGTFQPSPLSLARIPFLLLIVLSRPLDLLLWRPDNRLLPRKPPAKRRAVSMGYGVFSWL